MKCKKWFTSVSTRKHDHEIIQQCVVYAKRFCRAPVIAIPNLKWRLQRWLELTESATIGLGIIVRELSCKDLHNDFILNMVWKKGEFGGMEGCQKPRKSF